jgi:uncharacterized protein YegP (UPF0339 family)
MGAFVISKKNNGLYQFAFTSRKGKIIGTSLYFETLADCETTIELLKLNYEALALLISKATNGKVFFKLILNDQSLFVSRKYTTHSRMQKGIDECTISVFGADVLDFTGNQIFL